MRRVSMLLLAAILLAACTDRNVSVKITGNIKDGGNRMIRLALIAAEGMEMIDSTTMKNGQFEFKISSDNELIKERENAPMLFQLFLSEDNCMSTMAKKGEHLTITADAQDLVRTYQVSGGEEAILMHQLDSALTVFAIAAEELFKPYEKNLYNDSVKAAIEAIYMPMVEKHRKYLENFINNHPSNMVSYIAFYQSYNNRTFFDPLQDLDLLKKINANMSKVYPESEYVKTMIHVADMMEQRMQMIRQ